MGIMILPEKFFRISFIVSCCLYSTSVLKCIGTKYFTPALVAILPRLRADVCSVSEISKILKEQERLEIPAEMIELEKPIKEIGEYKIKVKDKEFLLVVSSQ